MGRQMKSGSRRAAVSAAFLAALAAPMAAHAEMTTATAGPFTYVCGGVAQDEQQQLRSEASRYDMGLLFTKGSSGEYLADVNVKLMRNGKQVAEFMSDGPRCLIKGPRASYQVVATLKARPSAPRLAPDKRMCSCAGKPI